jgi:hypothetical protein
LSIQCHFHIIRDTKQSHGQCAQYGKANPARSSVILNWRQNQLRGRNGRITRTAGNYRSERQQHAPANHRANTFFQAAQHLMLLKPFLTETITSRKNRFRCVFGHSNMHRLD